MGDAAPSNNLATGSLVFGVLTWLSFVLMMCIGFVPLLNTLSTLFYPVSFFCSLIAIVLGFVGYRQGMVSGAGRGSSILGVALGLAYVLLQVLVLLMVLFSVGGVFLLFFVALVTGNT